MKQMQISWLTSLFILFITFSLCGQKIAVENSNSNVAYAGVATYLTVIVENIPCEELFITSDNGIIRGASCEFNFTPGKPGTATLFIKRIIKSDTILLNKKIYRIRPFPKPTAQIGNQKSGKIKAAVLQANQGLIAMHSILDIDMSIPVTKYVMKIIRKGEVLCNISNEGARFNEDIQRELTKIKSGDKVYFEDIYAALPGIDSEEKLNVIVLEIE